MRGRAGQQLDHKLFAALRNDGFLRNHPRIVTLAKHGVDSGEHAGAQLQLAVVNTAAHPHRATIRINQRINRLHLSGVFAARQGINVQQGGLAPLDLALKTLGQAEVNKNRLDVFNVDNVCAILEVVAHTDLANPDSAIERREDFEAGCSGLRQRQLGLRHLQIGSAFIQRALADEVLRYQLLVTLLVGLGNRQLSHALLHLRQRQLVVKLHQQLPFAHALTIIEIELRDAAADLRANDNAPARTQTTHSLRVIGELDELYPGHFNRRRFAGGCSACRRTGSALHRPQGRCGAVVRSGLLKPPGRTGRCCDARDSDHRINCF